MESTIRGRRRTRKAFGLAAVLVLLLALVGGTFTQPAFGSIAGALRVAGDDCPPVPVAGQVIYGCTDLSRNLQAARLYLNKNKRFNPGDKLFQNARRSNYAIARLDDGTYIIGYSDSDLHAEERLIDQMQGRAPRAVFDPNTGTVSYQPAKAGTIAELYSELEPCSNKCLGKLNDLKLGGKTTWSWKWNGQAGDPKETVDAIHDAANNPKTGLKNVAIKQLFANNEPGRIDDPVNVRSGVTNAIEEEIAAEGNGGIDFTSVQLRYVSDGGIGGNTYSFRASTTPGQPSTDGRGAIFDAFNSLDTWLTVEASRFWVNLNPDQPDRIIDKYLGQTDVGHVLLQSDLDLKESGTKLVDPNTTVGAEFWRRMDAAGLNKFCLRNWIVPDPATVRQSGSELYILNAPLEVKAEGEDFTLPGGAGNTCPTDSKAAVDIYRQVILPELTREVNESATYTDLRRVYISRVAAEWYRQRLTAAGTAADYGVDSNDISTLESTVPWDPMDIWNKYVKEIDATTFHGPGGFTVTTGGVDFTQPVKVTTVDDTTFQNQYPKLPTVVQDSVKAVSKTPDNKNAFAGGVDQVPPLVVRAAPPSGQPGTLPTTGAPTMSITLIGIVLVLVGALVVWQTWRVTFRTRRR